MTGTLPTAALAVTTTITNSSESPMCATSLDLATTIPRTPLPDGSASHTKLCNAPSTKYYTGSAGGSTKRFMLGSSVVRDVGV